MAKQTRQAEPLNESLFRRIRGNIVRGLVQLAAEEPRRVPRGGDDGPAPTHLQRRESIGEALRALDDALSGLLDVIDHHPGEAIEKLIAKLHPEGRCDGTAAEFRGDAAQALETVRRLNLRISDAADSEKLEEFLAEKPLKAFIDEARKPISKLINRWLPVAKIFVAVHGIGDQFHNETVQNVAVRVCDYVGLPAALPLGRFHGGGATVTGAFLPDPDRDPPVDCGFAEIYWAAVPRGPAQEEHTLEDPKKWARNLVERLRLEAPDDSGDAEPQWMRKISGMFGHSDPAETARLNDRRLEQLLEELIQGVIVADRIVFLADKAGLFKFDLKKLLTDYLNDVQVVTEFEDYRRQLLDIFDEVLEKIHRYFSRSEIYIVAHSEGTVVSFLGLLEGLQDEVEWTKMIRGLMTIGSPLNKHVRFWPELFDQYRLPKADPPQPIRWKNYYDYGDPVGYDLKPTRAWLHESGWERFFAFRNPRDTDRHAPDSGDDIGFTRYYFPGEAHSEYWQDPGVFGHFLQEVVDPQQQVLQSKDGVHYGVPTTNWLARVTSYILPYVLAASLLFLACYILYKAVRGCLDPIAVQFETPREVLKNVLGLWGLIAGMSLLARMPRLASRLGWLIAALILAIGFSSLYLLVDEHNRTSIEGFLSSEADQGAVFNGLNDALMIALAVGVVLIAIPGLKALRPPLVTLLPVVFWVLLLRILHASFIGPEPALGEAPIGHAIALVSVTLLLGIMAWLVSSWFPESGTKPLILTGGLIILMVVSILFAFYDPKLNPLDQQALDKELHAEKPKPSAIARAVEDSARSASDKIPGIYLNDQKARSDLETAANMRTVSDAALNRGPIWPVYLAGGASLYVWWLAVVTFDLTFVWHLYIRWGGAQRHVERRIRQSRQRKRALEAQAAQAD
jgi:hypothetical protein